MPDVAIDVQDLAPAPTNPVRFTVLIRPVAIALEGDSVGGPADAVPPVVTLVSPASGQVEDSTPIVVEVTDNVALRRVLVMARFDSLGVEDLVHNGERFAAAYSGDSTRSPIAGGWRYVIRRNSGWRAPVMIDVYAFDTSGSEG